METCCLAVSMSLQNMKNPFVCKYVCMHSFMYCVHMWVMSAACISGSCVSTFGLAVVCVCVRMWDMSNCSNMASARADFYLRIFACFSCKLH